MAFTNDQWLPCYEELQVPELELTSSVLRAGAVYFGKYCDDQCKEYMLCVSEERDVRKCLNEGKEVTQCGFDFFGKVKTNCLEEFNKYAHCIDHSGSEMEFKYCRKPQAILDSCMKEKMNMERPEVGFFSLTRLHHTNRAKPELKPITVEPKTVFDVPDISKGGAVV